MPRMTDSSRSIVSRSNFFPYLSGGTPSFSLASLYIMGWGFLWETSSPARMRSNLSKFSFPSKLSSTKRQASFVDAEQIAILPPWKQNQRIFLSDRTLKNTRYQRLKCEWSDRKTHGNHTKHLSVKPNLFRFSLPSELSSTKRHATHDGQRANRRFPGKEEPRKLWSLNIKAKSTRNFGVKTKVNGTQNIWVPK